MTQNLSEETKAEEILYRGKIITLASRTVTLPNGQTGHREVVYHPGAVAVVAEARPGFVLCVRQFRTAPGEVLMEVPAGKIDPEESPETCAARELSEETGLVAGHLRKLFEFYTSPGFANERITLFHATDLTPGDTHPDEDEFVELIELSAQDVRTGLQNGVFRDAKTLIALLWWLRDIEGAD